MTNLDDQLRDLLKGGGHNPPSLSAETIRSVHSPAWRRAMWLTAVIVALGALGLGVAISRTDSDRPGVANGSMNPLLTHSDMPVQMTAAISTTAILKDRGGCLVVNGDPVIWPSGTTWDETDRSIVGESFTIRVGETFPDGLGGGLVPLPSVLGYLDGGSRSRALHCLAEDRTDVLVIN